MVMCLQRNVMECVHTPVGGLLHEKTVMME